MLSSNILRTLLRKPFCLVIFHVVLFYSVTIDSEPEVLHANVDELKTGFSSRLMAVTVQSSTAVGSQINIGCSSSAAGMPSL